MEVQEFIAKWSASAAAERANKDAFLLELCDLLEVPRPDPATGDPETDTYVFERDAFLPRPQGRGTIGKIDLYKQSCFLLEAKQGSKQESKKIGTARRGTPSWNIAMRDAFGQALGYARTLEQPPPFLVTCDIGYCFDLYATFDGSTDYRSFPDGRTSRIFLKDLPQHLDLLRQIFQDPLNLDPSRHAARVTREIAADLAALAHELEEDGHHPRRIATFLMRCIFTMFAEDMGLLPEPLFTKSLKDYWIPNPPSFTIGVTSLWRAMDEGTDFIVGKLRRFNGTLFSDHKPLRLSQAQLERLAVAAERDWSEVEPAIFGTLLEQALDAEERHRLGVHYTPRAYVERLIKPTVEEPLRRQWNLTLAEVRRLIEIGEESKAIREIQRFHQELTHIRVLDPACGTGNFLYVALDLFKRLETEVLSLLADLGEGQAALEMPRATVTPEQFRGLDINWWSKEIADLVLWTGYLQWQLRTYGTPRAIPEPFLQDYGNIELRDAVLDWDGEPEVILGAKGRALTHGNGPAPPCDSTTNAEAVNGEEPVLRYKNARPARWPEADFVVGNPPFVGNWRMRGALGHSYTETLRKVHQDVPESVDYVMYWWNQAAKLLTAGKIRRFGLITTNSISQKLARRVLTKHMRGSKRLSLIFAIPDHPWVETTDGAKVRIAMTVAAPGDHAGILGQVLEEGAGDSGQAIVLERRWGKIHPNLTVGPNVPAAVPLKANEGLSCPGVKLHGAGFLVSPAEARQLGLGKVRGLENYVRPYLNGRDLLHRSRELYVIDLYGLEAEEVRQRYPAVYQWILERVKPERDQNNRKTYRDKWWIFGEPRAELRSSIQGLSRYITTVETAKHRIFTYLTADILPDNMLVNFALEDAYYLGVLSSSMHRSWAQAAGGTLEDRPRYNKSRCFDPFPFPSCTERQKEDIRRLGEALDQLRKERLAEHESLTLTGLYNVLDKERSGEELTAKDREIHDQGLVSVLRELHEQLDAAVAASYGWSSELDEEEILERLVRLNAERAEEERNGHVRWLRPDYQAPAQHPSQSTLPGTALPEPAVAQAAMTPWPKTLPDRMSAVYEVLAQGSEWTVDQVASSFQRARRKSVGQALESLAVLGLVACFDEEPNPRWHALVHPLQAAGAQPRSRSGRQ